MSKSEKKIVINCALPYANSNLHIGHIAGAYLPPDIFNRFNRLIGKETLFICGTDENGTPVTLKAEEEGVEPQEIANRYHKEIKEDFESLDIYFDFFGRTTAKYHEEFVQNFFGELEQNGFLERKQMISAFCKNEKRFLPDRYVNGKCPYCGNESARGDQCDECGKTLDPQDLQNPKCAVCKSDVSFKETEHIFFKISNMEGFLKEWLSEKEDWRSNVKTFSINILESGLKDRAITRDINWGVKIEEPGMENKRIYVWFEALLGYLSNAQEYSRITGEPYLWKEYYEDNQTYYFMGKDNIFFHSIFLPALHKASGKYPLPFRISANEYLRFKGQKFSKSRGIGLKVREILSVVDKDSLRYYLSSILPESSDSDFSQEEMVEKVNSELNGKYGNLVNRVVSFCISKNVIPRKGEPDQSDINLISSLEKFREQYVELMKQVEFRKALSLWLENVKLVNTFFNNSKPWDIIKTDTEMVASKLWYALKAVEYLTLTIYPFVPSGSDRAWNAIHNESINQLSVSHLAETCTFKLNSNSKIFNKLEFEDEPDNQLNLIIGKIAMAENHPNADSLLHLRVNLGDHEIELVAGLRKYYDPASLQGRKIVVVENLKPSKLRGIVSQGMLLAAQDSKGVHILTSDLPEGTAVTMGEIGCANPQRIEIDTVKSYELRVETDSSEQFPTALVGRNRLPLLAMGKKLKIDGMVENKSIIK